MNSDPTLSPLSQASPRSLDELFAADVETLTDSDIDLMISELRNSRAVFKHAKAQRASKPTAIPLGSSDEILDMIGLGTKK